MTDLTASMTACERVTHRLRHQLGDGWGVVCSGITAEPEDLYPAERSTLARAVPKRRREYATGRRNARLAMAQIGQQPTAIPSGPDRAPVWPAHLVGSISHSDHACLAVVGLRSRAAAIGVDLEEDLPMDEDLWPTICTPEETRQLHAHPAAARGRWVTRLFSAKEAVYKWQYPLTGRLLDFQQVQVIWLATASETESDTPFTAELTTTHTLPAMQGRCFASAGQVVSWACAG